MKIKIIMTLAVLSLSLLAPPAQAAGVIDDRQISSSAKLDIRSANAILKRATNSDHTVLNYAKAKAEDKGRYIARRKFAAAFEWRGGRITNISAAEHAKVRAYYDGKPSWASINGSPVDRVEAKARNCLGRSEVTGDINIAAGTFDIKYWMDSCDVKAVKLWIKGAAGLSGLFAAGGFLDGRPSLALQSAIVGAYLAAGGELLGYYADTSDIGAAWLRDHWHVVTMGRQ